MICLSRSFWHFQAVALAILLVAAAGAAEKADSRLKFPPDAFGNVIPDFSLAGYRHGGVPLPTVPVVETLKPQANAEDDAPRIQAALDRAGKMPERAEDGVRAAVLLTRGAYRCTTGLRVPAGVTLRGEGAQAEGTILLASMSQRNSNDKPTLIRLTGRGKAAIDKTGHAVENDAPLGTRHLKVTAAGAFKSGDTVLVERLATQSWIHDLKMDQMKLQAGDKQWSPDGYHLRWWARVVSVEGDWLTLDTPVVCALERRYGGGSVYKVTSDSRGRAAAVEKIRAVSSYQRGKENSDENHAWNAITIDGLVDCWVREVTAVHFAYSCVGVAKSASRITVQDCAMLDPVSEISGGRRYSFVGGGQFVLFQRCYARNGRHDFVTGHADLGPTVFLDCLAEKTHADIGPHHRWACGQLYDNVRGGQINVQDRGASGTGHGWAGNCQVLWNCEAQTIICQKPWIPSAQNWAVGCIGAKGKPSQHDRPEGLWISPGKRIAPRSLYLAQLKDRIELSGGNADAAIRVTTTADQRDGTIWQSLQRRFAEDR